MLEALALLVALSQQAASVHSETKALDGFPGAKVIEWDPDPSVIQSETLRQAIAATKLPWRISIELPSRIDGREVETIEMLLIPPGSFVMGQSLNDATVLDREKRYSGRSDSPNYYETPAHEVRLTRPFYLSRAEISAAAWDAVWPSDHNSYRVVQSEYVPRKPDSAKQRETYNARIAELRAKGMTASEAEKAAGPAPSDSGTMRVVKDPEESVYADPYALRSFLATLQRKTKPEKGWCFELPTEAEWEYACRAGTRTPRYAAPGLAGPTESKSESGSARATKKSGKSKPTGDVVVPNGFGLRDMLGGKSEWTADGYFPFPYPDGPIEDPICLKGELATPAEQLMRPGVDPILVYWHVVRGSSVPSPVEGSTAPIASYREIVKWNPGDSDTDYPGGRAGVRLCLRQGKTP
jgi:formylglycine-generating enzyme required for sulfatase activity